MITVVYFWQIKKVFLPIAILFMAFHKFALMRLPGVSFVKLLGTELQSIRLKRSLVHFMGRDFMKTIARVLNADTK